jgi:cytochrome d ubiquinol oxidase subunit II
MWHSLVPIWTVILGLGVFIYVALDGFDLGVGMLHGLVPLEDRETVMDSIGPFWDGNETWLILGGVGLLAAFPVAFAIIIPAVYFPILIMLLALVFRGVAFEFRFKHPGLRRFWDGAFTGGSLVATFAQGVVLGSFIQGFKVEGRVFTGTSFDFATPFALLTGVALVFGYALLGAGWLVLKTEGGLQDWARKAGERCLAGVSVCILAVSVWTPLASAAVASRWFGWPNTLLLLPLPILAFATGLYTLRAFGFERASRRAGDWHAFAGSIMLFALSFLGIAISLWPMIVPGHYTLWDAASPESTQAFLLVGTLVLLPTVLFYTGWSYWVFRGKVRAGGGYHGG